MRISRDLYLFHYHRAIFFPTKQQHNDWAPKFWLHKRLNRIFQEKSAENLFNFISRQSNTNTHSYENITSYNCTMRTWTHRAVLDNRQLPSPQIWLNTQRDCQKRREKKGTRDKSWVNKQLIIYPCSK